MDNKSNSLNWFEIPATDITRAKKFYENVFSVTMEDMPEMMGIKMSAFPGEMGNGKVTGALAQSDMHKPAAGGGPVIYLNANPNIQAVIDRVEGAGGKITMPKTEISPEIGYMAFFVDSEGNNIGLHAQQ